MGALADPKIVKERQAICSTCPKWDPKLDRCKACKCFLKLKNKLLNAKCPEGKWKR